MHRNNAKNYLIVSAHVRDSMSFVLNLMRLFIFNFTCSVKHSVVDDHSHGTWKKTWQWQSKWVKTWKKKMVYVSNW